MSKFPDDYRKTIERLVLQQIEDARRLNFATVQYLESLLARIRAPDFGICRNCGVALSFARLIQDASRTLCQQCDAEGSAGH